MNDEINIKFGGDLTGIGTALRGLKGMADKAAESIKDSFKDVFHHLTAPLSIAGAFEAVRSVMEDVKNIKRISESTGLDTGITQDMLNLGKAAGIAGDAIESAMDRFVKNLAPGSDPEQALYNIADRLESIKDPAERARIATEAFGKAGEKLIPILDQGADGVRRLSEEWGKLSDAEIDQLEQADRTLEKTGNKSKVLLAQLIEGGKMTADKLNAMPAWKKIVLGPLALIGAIRDATTGAATPDDAEMASDNAKEAQKVENAKAAAQAKKDAAIKAAKELAEQEELMNAKPQEKVLLLTRQILAVRREMEDTDDDKKREQLTQKLLSLERDRKGVSDEISRTQKESAEKQKALANEILDTHDKLAKLGRERDRAQSADYMPSLQELATSGSYRVSGSATVWQQGPFALMARQLMNLQEDAKQSLIFGNKGRFQNDVSKIEDLKQALRSVGVMSQDDKMDAINENTDKTQRHLEELVRKSSAEGLKVIGPDD